MRGDGHAGLVPLPGGRDACPYRAGGDVAAVSSKPPYRLAAPKFMWAYLAHFGMKLWERRCHYTDLKVDNSMWKSLTDRAAEIGVNVFVFDLGEGMVFPSHPELAVRGSWEPERMKDKRGKIMESLDVMAAEIKKSKERS